MRPTSWINAIIHDMVSATSMYGSMYRWHSREALSERSDLFIYLESHPG